MVKCPWCNWEGTAEEYMRHYDEKHSGNGRVLLKAEGRAVMYSPRKESDQVWKTVTDPDISYQIRATLNKCDLIKNFHERLSCKSKVLNDVTKVQDTINLDIMGDFSKTDPRCSEDPRWIPVHIVDDANAMILGISEAEFQPKVFWHPGSYVQEKFDSLEKKLFTLISNETGRGDYTFGSVNEGITRVLSEINLWFKPKTKEDAERIGKIREKLMEAAYLSRR
jgi:hypothetical protein